MAWDAMEKASLIEMSLRDSLRLYIRNEVGGYEANSVKNRILVGENRK